VLTEPNETPPTFYRDLSLRGSTPLDTTADHEFLVRLDQGHLRICVNQFEREFNIHDMPKVLGPGLIRFQSYGCWMGLLKASVTLL